MTERDEARDADDIEIDEELDDIGIGFDWVVFIGRIAALLVFGATLATSVDISFNQGQAWTSVMRLAIEPFAAGMIILVLVEILDRRGD